MILVMLAERLGEKMVFSKAINVVKEKRLRQTLRAQLLKTGGRLTSKTLSALSKIDFLSSFFRFEELSFGFVFMDSYFTTNNAGLMSCASTTLSDLHQSKLEVLKIKSNLGLGLYKKSLFRDNWPRFFQLADAPSSQVVHKKNSKKTSLEISEWWSSDYATLPLAATQALVEKHFRLSAEVKKLVRDLQERHEILLTSTVGVHYRGTDKSFEISTPSIHDFIIQTKNAISQIPGSRILLLTDEPEALRMFNDAFPGVVFRIEEISIPGGTIGAHNLDSKDNEHQGVLFLAALALISQCGRVVTHTGNGALWEVLLRGQIGGVTQVRKA
jgi:hypothetical protein